MLRCFPQRLRFRSDGRRFRNLAASMLKRTLATAVLPVLLAVGGSAQTPAVAIPDFSKGPDWFPSLLNAYRAIHVPPPKLGNPPSLTANIQNGTYPLSLRQVLLAVAENNLDINSSRYD